MYTKHQWTEQESSNEFGESEKASKTLHYYKNNMINFNIEPIKFNS